MLECCDKCVLKCFAANVHLETLKHQHSVIQHSLRSQEIRRHRFKNHHFHRIFFVLWAVVCPSKHSPCLWFFPFRDFLGKWPADVYLSKIIKKNSYYSLPTCSLHCLAHMRLVCCGWFCGCVFGIFVFCFCVSWTWIIEINALPFSDCWVISCSFWSAGEIIRESQA